MNKRVRGGSGLGDSVYLRPVVDHLISAGNAVTVLSDYAGLFIDSGATVESFNKLRVDIIAHYALHRAAQDSTQWDDILKSAGLPPDLPLRFTWNIRNTALVQAVRGKADGRPIIIIHGGRAPFGRSDGVGMEILPECAAFETVLGALEDCFTVRVGHGNQLYPLAASLDLHDRTTVSDLCDLFTLCDGAVTQCGWPIPLAECFDKPVLAVWAARGLVSTQPIIAHVTPAKILCKATSGYVMDNWPEEAISMAARAFCQSEALAV